MIQKAIAALVAGEDLTGSLAREVAREILDGQASPCQIAAFITALRIRKERVEHIVAFAEALREKAGRVRAPEGVVLDTCGTGGDGRATFNVSTAAAIIAAGAGACVAKHGNRAVSSACGSADVLAQLGVRIDADRSVMERCLGEIGLCFLFAPACHGAMKHAGAARKEVGIRSIFNMVGPLVNPAGATHQMIGVYAPELTETYAEVLRRLGSERVLAVHGSDGMDEITITGPTQVTELRDGKIETRTIQPSDFGVQTATPETIMAHSAEEAAQRMREVLSGQKGPCLDVALMNAGAALYVAGLADTMQDGFALAAETVASGKAAAKLQALVTFTNAA
jgi:anthranilate phosphoribosyltransferase